MSFGLIEKVLPYFRQRVQKFVTRADAHGLDFDGIDNRYGQRTGNLCAFDLRAGNRDFVNDLLVIFRFLRKRRS
jgi:hypothetical protein